MINYRLTELWICISNSLNLRINTFILPEHLSSPSLCCGVHVAWSLVFCVMFCRPLCFPFSFVQYIVYCSTCGFWLLSWYRLTCGFWLLSWYPLTCGFKLVLIHVTRGFQFVKGCTRFTAASDKVYQLLAHGRWFSPASSTIKTGRHDIAQILLKLALKCQKSKI